VLARAGQPISQLLIVLEGRLRAGPLTLGPGDSYGWRAMRERLCNEVTVVAEAQTRLLVMGHAQFRAVKSLAPLPTIHLGRWSDATPGRRLSSVVSYATGDRSSRSSPAAG
jgi:CRP-like cAMP-binding protein